ncbi:MAG: hypothetical protein VKN13_04860 [Cyanobacteriota bacterium]|nr:hypothetical protein [Cyanobacteriota bacterium]
MARRLVRSEALAPSAGDGTTAALRLQQAPDPTQVNLDPGGSPAALRFLQAMASQLRWTTTGEPASQGIGLPSVDWQPLFNPAITAAGSGERPLATDEAATLTPEAISSFWEHPEPTRRFTLSQLRWLGRPQFALVLVFLQLMRHYRELLNTVPARHLDHYLVQRLGFQRQPAVPNQVTVAFELAPEAPVVHLPSGTLLSAGVDAGGNEIHYRTTRDLGVNHARLAELRALHVERDVTTLTSLREGEPSAARAFEGMLRLVYGSPRPGDGLPPLLVDGLAPQTVSTEWLVELIPLLRFFWTALKLEIEEFQQIMRLVAHRQDSGATAEWQWIEARLGLGRLPAKERQTLIANRHFETWFCASVFGIPGQTIDWQRDGISDLNGIDDLHLQAHQDDVARFLQDLLDRPSCLIDGTTPQQKLDCFRELMVLKLHIDNEWRQINWLLQRVGQRQRRQPTWQLADAQPVFNATDFSANLLIALNGASVAATFSTQLPGWAAGLAPGAPGADLSTMRRLDTLLWGLESWFAMPAERLLQLAGLMRPSAGGQAWAAIDGILQAAHCERQRSHQQAALVGERHAAKAGTTELSTFEAMVAAVVQAAPIEQHAGSSGVATWPFNRTLLAPWLTSGQLEQLDRFHELLVQPGSAPRRLSWPEVEALLTAVQTKLKGWQPQALAKVQWRMLHRHQQPIEVGAVSAATPLQPSFTIPVADPGSPPEPGPGFGLASGLLALAEGQRTLVLTLALEPQGLDPAAVLAELVAPDGQALAQESCAGQPPLAGSRGGWGLNQALQLELSTAEGWHVVPLAAARLEPPLPAEAPGSYWSLSQQRPPKAASEWGVLQLTVKLNGAAPPLAALPPEPLPRLRVRLRPWLDSDTGRWRSFSGFEGLRLAAAHLRVMVAGITSLRLQQESTPLDPLEPFAPFGASPAVGANLYISHPELLADDFDFLCLQARWCKLPPNLASHYSLYSNWPGLAADARVSGESFEVEATLLARQCGPVRPPLHRRLFDGHDPGRLRIELAGGVSSSAAAGVSAEGADNDLRLQARVWRLRLTPLDFGHGLFPVMAARKAQELALAISGQAAGQALAMADAISRTGGTIAQRYQDSLRSLASAPVNPGDYTVPEPYTPLLEGLEASYSRSMTLRPGEATAGNQLLHLHPFGEDQIPADAPTLLPGFPHTGELLLALAGCEPPQTMTLAFQLAEGSARGPRCEPPLRWEVRDGQRWLPLQVHDDGTGGLLHSGIVRFMLPVVARPQGLPAEHLWVRASLLGPVEGYATILAIQTQAVEAEGLSADGVTPLASAPLAPDSIQDLVEGVPEIVAIHQPFSSRGGQPSETMAALRLRAAETLRHKGRALATWDYERLLWQAFGSQLHKVICRPGADGMAVEVLVVPNLREQVPRNLQAPGAASDLLVSMETHLRGRCPPDVSLRVRNPTYVHVQAQLWVCLMHGADPTDAEEQLQRALSQALSPWCFDADADVNLGGSIQLTELAEAVDRLTVVHHLEKLSLVLVDARGQPRWHREGESSSSSDLAAPSDDSIFIAFSRHNIHFITAFEGAAASHLGIGSVKIQSDLQVA